MEKFFWVELFWTVQGLDTQMQYHIIVYDYLISQIDHQK